MVRGGKGSKVVAIVIGCIGGAAVLAGCAGRATQTASGMPVQALVADRLTLHGTAQPTLANPSCSASPPAKPSHVIEMAEETRATVLLTAALGEPPLPLATLHITNVETHRSWCVTTKTDGSPAALATVFPSGTYEVSIAETDTAAPRRYEVKLQKL
jgi:xanthine dehydrogenase molybdopterin-binding subunit B